jgi:hypothetical protein
MLGSQSSGMQMMVKALLPSLGFNPEEFAKKAVEFERLFKTVLTDVQTKVTSIEERLTNIETLLVALANQTAQVSGSVVPAGDTWVSVVEPTEHESSAHAERVANRNRKLVS